jgi:hypothetical protein
MRTASTLAISVGLALTIAGAAAAQTQIGVPPGNAEICCFGPATGQSWGQTFTAPPSGALTDFSFWIWGPAPDLRFRGYVFAWDEANGRATGRPLFTSETMSAPADSQLTKVTVRTGSLALRPGARYVAFLSFAGIAGAGSTSWHFASNDAYPGGAFVTVFGRNPAVWTTRRWRTDHGGAGRDARFEMNFSAPAAANGR